LSRCRTTTRPRQRLRPSMGSSTMAAPSPSMRPVLASRGRVASLVVVAVAAATVVAAAAVAAADAVATVAGVAAGAAATAVAAAAGTATDYPQTETD
jgi:hypothetical protein